MEEIVWTELSQSSLNDIWEFYAEKNIEAAEKILNEIISAAENIRFGGQYQAEELLGEEFRRAIVRHFKIIYRIEKDHLRIIDVFDARQDPKKLKK